MSTNLVRYLVITQDDEEEEFSNLNEAVQFIVSENLTKAIILDTTLPGNNEQEATIDLTQTPIVVRHRRHTQLLSEERVDERPLLKRIASRLQRLLRQSVIYEDSQGHRFRV